jgi:hypothetical protein
MMVEAGLTVAEPLMQRQSAGLIATPALSHEASTKAKRFIHGSRMLTIATLGRLMAPGR